MMTSGFLWRFGQFDLVPMYFALMAGDFVADLGWYFVGRFGARGLVRRFGGHFGITEENIERVEKLFHKYHTKILVISKLTMGLGFAVVVLIVAGILRVPFKRYVAINLLGGFFWTAFLVAVGYFFGNIYLAIPAEFKVIFIVFLILLVSYILWRVNKYLQKKRALL
jgi:membrane protein DedA with SNARE-associated domain